MQQIKCNICEHTKFFVNSIAETSMISCCECGASFIIGTPAQAVKEPEQVEEDPVLFKDAKGKTINYLGKPLYIDKKESQELEQVEEPKSEFTEEPKEIEIEELEQPVEEKEVVVEKKPLIRKLSPEEKQKLLLEMEKGEE